MSQLATIFRKIKDDFVNNHLAEEDKEKYRLLFSPFSTGFDYEDFLFLDTNKAAEEAHKYYDELYEFSQMANTICRGGNFWSVSGNRKDYLYSAYGEILRGLKLMDPDTLTIKMISGHPVFLKVLNLLQGDDFDEYRSYDSLIKKLGNEITALTENAPDNVLEIDLKKESLEKLETTWEAFGNRQKVEAVILNVVKDEFKRFMRRFIATKSAFESAVRTHVEDTFYYTSCTPNNLYKGNSAEWKKIEIRKPELDTLSGLVREEEYGSIFGNSDMADIDIEKIEFELLFAKITRPWFDESLLRSPFWNMYVLNREDIDIPEVTTEFIFVRNVRIELPEHSDKNKKLLRTDQIQNLGPFIINTAQLRTGQKLNLNSVNTALNINRKTILNVSSGLEKKNKHDVQSMRTLISKKQQQFVTLAPRLQTDTVTVKKVNKARVTPRIAMEPKMKFTKMSPHIKFLLNVKGIFSFKDRDNQAAVAVLPQHLLFTTEGKPANITLINTSGHILEGSFNRNAELVMEVKVPGYVSQRITFTPASLLTGQVFTKNVLLQKEVKPTATVASEGFQLIGVVTRITDNFPTPIRGADYL